MIHESAIKYFNENGSYPTGAQIFDPSTKTWIAVENYCDKLPPERIEKDTQAADTFRAALDALQDAVEAGQPITPDPANVITNFRKQGGGS